MMNEARRHAGTLELRGGCLCLDFANTVGWHASDHPQEWLFNYTDLIAWSHHTSILTDFQTEHLFQEARDHPASVEAVFARATSLREVIYQIFSLVVQGSPAREEDLTILHRAYSEAVAHAHIMSIADGFALDWQGKEYEPDFPLWLIAHSAMGLLTSRELHQVKACPGDGCGWLFVDMSRNQSRRWCNGQDCGNRVRVRHYTQRRKISNEQ